MQYSKAQACSSSSGTPVGSAVAAAGRPKVIIITGPTAVGKTKLGLELAKQIGGEIISADSVQVYQGLDIGSDKLPLGQRQGIPHHLIDILPPQAEFSAGDFHHWGRAAAEDIISRGKVPIVVGGTGFYLRWFVYGKADTPPSTPEAAARAQNLIEAAWQQAAAAAAAAAAARQPATQPDQQKPHPQQAHQQQHRSSSHQKHQQQQQQEQQQQQPVFVGLHAAPSATAAAAAAALSEEQRWAVAVDVVRQLGDAVTAQRLLGERNNWYRLQRVLQILLQNGGRPLGDLDVDTSRPLDYDFRCFFLHRPRVELYDRIVFRVEEMVAAGLLREALLLLQLGMAPNSHMATKAIGYRQACRFMQTALQQGSASREQVQQLILEVATASRNLVKNQTTWFRDDPLFRWVEVGGRSTGDVLAELLSQLSQQQHEAGCGDSGRLDRNTQRALKRYVPCLKLFGSRQECDGRVAEALDWIRAAAAAAGAATPAASEAHL